MKPLQPGAPRKRSNPEALAFRVCVVLDFGCSIELDPFGIVNLFGSGEEDVCYDPKEAA